MVGHTDEVELTDVRVPAVHEVGHLPVRLMSLVDVLVCHEPHLRTLLSCGERRRKLLSLLSHAETLGEIRFKALKGLT